jgi:hypothetical protein
MRARRLLRHFFLIQPSLFDRVASVYKFNLSLLMLRKIGEEKTTRTAALFNRCVGGCVLFSSALREARATKRFRTK